MENNNSPAPYSLIPLSSNEPLFEWDIVSDALFMTQGLYKSLNLPSPPPTMADFYKLLTADAATELGALRKNILLGKDPAASECSYLCNGFWVQEYMLVLSRNSRRACHKGYRQNGRRARGACPCRPGVQCRHPGSGRQRSLDL